MTLIVDPTITTGTESQDWSGDIPPQEKSSILRDLREIQLQFRETLPLAGKEVSWVCRVRFLIVRNLISSSNSTLEFVAAPALAPAEVAVDANLMATYEAELKRVRTLPSEGPWPFRTILF